MGAEIPYRDGLGAIRVLYTRLTSPLAKKEGTGYNRSGMPLDVLGRTRATISLTQGLF